LVHTHSNVEKDAIATEATGADISGAAAMAHDYEGKPTPEELTSLRRVADKLPTVAYVLCFAELCERASYYGTANVIGNFVNRKLPVGGNGGGAPPKDKINQTGGALGLYFLRPTQSRSLLRCWSTFFPFSLAGFQMFTLVDFL